MSGNGCIRRSEIYMILIVIQLMSHTTVAERHTPNQCDHNFMSTEYCHNCECTKEEADNLYKVNCNGQLLLSDLSVPLFNVSEQNLPFTIRVSHLDLSNNEISKLPDTFFIGILHIDRLLLSNNSLFMFPAFNMTTIRELDLLNNHFTHLDIIDIEDLASLKTLKLMKNNIVNLSSGVLSGISNSELQELDLSHNKITNIPLDFIARLKKLNWLDLHKNVISEVHEHHPDKVQDSVTTFLDLSYNKIRALPVEAFIYLRNLELLNISNNEISIIHSATFNHLHKLKMLDMSTNHLETLPLFMCQPLTALETLKLSSNRITVFQNKEIDLSETLKHLDLSENQISRLNSYSFKPTPNLETLNFAGNNDLESVQGVWFPDTLKVLDLSNCAIQELFECDFHNIQNLSVIHLHGNNLSCDCHMAWLKERYQNHGAVRSLSFNPGTIAGEWMCLLHQTKLISFENVPIQDFVCYNRTHEQEYCAPKLRYEEFISELHVSVLNDEIIVTWKLSFHHRLLGIQVVAEYGDETLESPILHISNSEYHLVGIKSRVTYNVCLYAYANTTTNIKMRCQEISNTDLSYLIGILAGAIFLIPCIVALLCIIFSDKKKQLKYRAVENEYTDSPVITDSHKHNKNIAVVAHAHQETKDSGSEAGYTNLSFLSEDGANVDKNSRKSSRKNSISNKTHL